MSTSNHPSSFAWFIVHVIFPLSPFFIEGVIRIVVFDNSVNWTTFSSSTLAMSVGLLCLFVSQSLVTHRRIIPSQEETEKMVGFAHMFSCFAIFCFVFFGAIILLSALIEKSNPNGVATIKSTFDVIILIGASVPVIISLFAQKSFKLRTSL